MKLSQIQKAIAALQSERDVLDLAIRKLLAQVPAAKPQTVARVRKTVARVRKGTPGREGDDPDDPSPRVGPAGQVTSPYATAANLALYAQAQQQQPK